MYGHFAKLSQRINIDDLGTLGHHRVGYMIIGANRGKWWGSQRTTRGDGIFASIGRIDTHDNWREIKCLEFLLIIEWKPKDCVESCQGSRIFRSFAQHYGFKTKDFRNLSMKKV